LIWNQRRQGEELPLAIGKSEVRGGVSHEVVLSAIADCQQA
ncbi:MAG: hypothetical protein ACE5GP_18815, partial [Salmonella enterica]